MATEEEKKRNLARINAMIIYGLEKGLGDLFGESALATTNTVGAGMLEVLEKSMGLEIDGENPQDMLTEIARIFVDEYGIALDFDAHQEGDRVALQVKRCVLMQVEKDLVAQGIKPFVCPCLNIAAAAMRQRMDAKTKISQFDIDTEAHICTLGFELL